MDKSRNTRRRQEEGWEREMNETSFELLDTAYLKIQVSVIFSITLEVKKSSFLHKPIPSCVQFFHPKDP